MPPETVTTIVIQVIATVISVVGATWAFTIGIKEQLARMEAKQDSDRDKITRLEKSDDMQCSKLNQLDHRVTKLETKIY